VLSITKSVNIPVYMESSASILASVRDYSVKRSDVSFSNEHNSDGH
jgi:hypothetical protein